MTEVTILSIGDTVIVPIQAELSDLAVKSLQENILHKIEKIGARGLIIDVSVVSIIDSFFARVLLETSRMAELMGAKTIIVGMKKEVVITLLHLGMVIKHLNTALNLEDGLTMLNRRVGVNHETTDL